MGAVSTDHMLKSDRRLPGRLEQSLRNLYPVSRRGSAKDWFGGLVIHFDAQKPLSKLFQLVHFAICDKYVESAARLCSHFQGEKRFCKIHRSLHEISLIGLMLDFCTLC